MNIKLIKIKLMLISALAWLLVSCGGGSGSNSGSSIVPTTLNINIGFAQKGPFSIGSNVTITRLNSSAIPIESILQTKVSSNNGSFSYEADEINLDTYFRIQAQGYYLDENTGTVSDNQINLTAITNNPKKSSVNLVTHWISQRTEYLLTTDKSLEASLVQSQKELLSIFGINNSNALDLTSSTTLLSNDNAMLLLLSGALMEASQNYEVDPQIIIDEISADFKDDGQLSEKGDNWFIRLQSQIKGNPKFHTKKYAKQLRDTFGFKISLENDLPALIPLASRPVANIPPELLAEPSEIITLDGSASHDSGDIINFTWFRVDQQTQYNIQVSDRFIASPTITVPDEATVLAAPNQEISLLYALVVTDADKLTHTSVVKVIVRIPPPLNNPPVADSQSLETDEDTPIAIILSASDIDGDSINFVLNTPLSTPYGIVTLDSSQPNVLYTPTQDYFGTDSFTFIVNDGFANSNTATINIQVNPVNDPPVADAGVDQPVESLTTVTLDGSGSTDVDGNIDAYLWTQTLGSTVTFNPTDSNPSFTAPEVLSASETLTFDLIVTDDDGESSSIDSVNIEVNPATVGNTPPTAIASYFGNQPFDELTEITLRGTESFDDDGNIVTYLWEQIGTPVVALNDPDAANPVFDAPAVTTTVPLTLTFRLIVTDDNGATDSDIVEIMVINASTTNRPPIANAGEDRTEPPLAQFALLGGGTDPDGFVNGYSWRQISGTPAGLFGSSSRVARVNPPNVTTSEVLEFELFVTDNEGLVSLLPDTVSITIDPAAPINNRPTAKSFEINLNQDSPIIIPQNSDQLGGEDIDGDDLTIIIQRVPQDGVLNITNNGLGDIYTYTPDPGFCGTDRFDFNVFDGHMVSSTFSHARVTLNVNCKPIADNIGDINIDFSSVDILLSGTDADGVIASYEIVTPPTEGTFDPNLTLPNLLYIPNNVPVPDEFTYRVIDNKGLASDPVTVKLIIGNRPPIATSQLLFLPPSVDLPFNLNDYSSDPDGDSFTFELIGEPTDSGIELTFSSDFTVLGTGNAHPLDGGVWARFQYRVIDEHGASSSIEEILIKDTPNSRPRADAGPDQTITALSFISSDGPFERTPDITLDGSGSTDFEDPISNLTFIWTFISGPNGRTTDDPSDTLSPVFTIGGGVGVDISGDYIYRLVVTDTDGLSDSDDVTITVNPALIPIGPTANAGPDGVISHDGEDTEDINLVGSGTDPDNLALTYSWELLTAVPNAGIYEDASGFNSDDVTTPTALAIISGGRSEMPDSVTYRLTVRNTAGFPATDEVTYTIQHIPDAQSDSVCREVTNSTSFPVTLVATDYDGDDSNIIFNIKNLPTGSLNVGLGPISGNQVVYTPDTSGPNGNIIDDFFVFTATDEQGWESFEVRFSISAENLCP